MGDHKRPRRQGIIFDVSHDHQLIFNGYTYRAILTIRTYPYIRHTNLTPLTVLVFPVGGEREPKVRKG